MCGITGIWGSDVHDLAGAIRSMADAITHRGPDSSGLWIEPEAGMALELEGQYPFRGHSDTEVLLASVEAWGLENALRRFVGMFAFALWDRDRRELHLVRDRLGIKPLYYGCMGGRLLFGSELRALRAHPAFRGTVDRGALALLLRHNCIPAPYSIWHGIRKLTPGSVLTLRTPADQVEPRPFWSAREVAECGMAAPFRGTEAEAVDALEALLRDAVGLRMIADVPLGAFLSGGVDSSTVVALMQAQSGRPVKTFSIGFQEDTHDEARHASLVAHHLGTEHTEMVVTHEDALAVISRLPVLYDEPFADSSQIPTFLVSALARKYVTVALSGDGGDELFAGYNRHVWGRRVGGAVRWVPRWIRRAGAEMLARISPAEWDRVYGSMVPALPGLWAQSMFGEKVHKMAAVLGADGPTDLYRQLVSHWTEPASVVRGTSEPPTVLTGLHGPALADPAAQMMYWDMVSYLPDDILTKVDRASMAVGLEARVPLLDHRVVEFAWTIPMSMKLRDGQSKWLLRQVLYRHIPRHLVERPKMGFAIPLGEWLRGPLREWAEDLLDERRLREEGFFDPATISRAWAEHLSGRRNWQHHLWDVLIFQGWLAEQNATAPKVVMLT
jgi:asparagine synthase (glutamine-hydrolysing)